MMKKITRFHVSLFFNILMFSMLLFVGIYKRNRIKTRIIKFLGTNSPSEKILSTFNNEPLEVQNEYYDCGAVNTISILFWGNSITYCIMPDEELDKTKRGLTSTGKDKDYVHLLVKKIAENKNVNINYSITNTADFECTFTLNSFNKDVLKNATV